MTEFLQSHPEWFMIGLVAVAVITVVFGAIILTALWLGREVVFTKTGFSFPVKASFAHMHNICEHIDKIDRQAKYTLRNATLSLPIDGINDVKQSEFVRLRMLLPLLFATYENHHTRELSERSISEYIENKINQIMNCIGPTRNLDKRVVESLVIKWTRKMAGAVASACREKMQIYKKYMVGADVETKAVLQNLIDKNELYIIRADELNTYSAIENEAMMSGVIHPGKIEHLNPNA